MAVPQQVAALPRPPAAGASHLHGCERLTLVRRGDPVGVAFTDFQLFSALMRASQLCTYG